MSAHWLPVFIFGIWPFIHHLAFGSAGSTDVGLIAVIGAIWLVFLLGIAAIVHGKAPLPQQSRLAAALAAFVALLFCYGFLEAAILRQINYWLPFRYLLGAWLVPVLVGGVLAYRFGNNPTFMRVLTALGVILMLIPLGTLIRNMASQAPLVGSGSPSTNKSLHASGRPNVYFFVFDAYGRADQLQEAFGFDNSPFMRFLEQQGFVVQAASNTNYPITDSAFTAVLSMLYHTEYESFRQSWPWQLGLWKSAVLKGNGPVVRKFRSMGYGYVHAEGAYESSRCGGLEDLCVRGNNLGLLDSTLVSLLAKTPLLRMIEAVFPAAVNFEPTEFDQVVQAMPKFPAAPIFVYSHIFMPHDSDRYPDCRKRESSAKGTEGSLEGNPGPYLDTILCVNRQVRQMLPRLLAADPTAVVIIQSDHGFTGEFKPFEELTEVEINRRYGNLDAMRLPERCRSMVSDGTTPVNTFRIVFACLEQRPADLLPDQSYAIWYHQKKPPTLLRKY
jgi:hypothetical protein